MGTGRRPREPAQPPRPRGEYGAVPGSGARAAWQGRAVWREFQPLAQVTLVWGSLSWPDPRPSQPLSPQPCVPSFFLVATPHTPSSVPLPYLICSSWGGEGSKWSGRQPPTLAIVPVVPAAPQSPCRRHPLMGAELILAGSSGRSSPERPSNDQDWPAFC